MKQACVSESILVTGAGGGMGQAICTRLAAEGHRILALDRRFPEDVPTVSPDETAGTDASPWKEGEIRRMVCDVTVPASVEQAFRWAETAMGHLDAVVHTAGVYDLDSLVEMDEERFLRVFRVNLFGVYRINRTFLPLLSSGGRIVITTSELATVDPLPFTGVYAVSKAALEKYAYSLRMELQLLGIRVSVIRPGAVRTSLLGDSTAALARFCEHTSLYTCNAERFRFIVDHVEARHVPPERIARLVGKALTSKHPRYVYNINRNPLLRLYGILPHHMQTGVIRLILKPSRKKNPSVSGQKAGKA